MISLNPVLRPTEEDNTICMSDDDLSKLYIDPHASVHQTLGMILEGHTSHLHMILHHSSRYCLFFFNQLHTDFEEYIFVLEEDREMIPTTSQMSLFSSEKVNMAMHEFLVALQ